MMDGVLFTKNASATNKREEFFKMNLDYHVQTLFALMYLYEKKMDSMNIFSEILGKVVLPLTLSLSLSAD